MKKTCSTSEVKTGDVAVVTGIVQALSDVTRRQIHLCKNLNR